MINLKLTSLAVLIAIFLSGCTKKQELDITMTLVSDGNLEIAFVDSEGEGLSDVLIQLYNSYSDYEGYGVGLIADATTDEGGKVIFDKLLSDNYIVYAEEVAIGSKDYTVIQAVQVIAGETKNYTMNPADFSGEATIRVIEYWDEDPVNGINVVVFPSQESYVDSYSEAISLKIDSGTTNSKGEVTFEDLPLGTYGIMVYTSSNDYNIDNYAFVITSKGEKETETVYWDSDPYYYYD